MRAVLSKGLNMRSTKARRLEVLEKVRANYKKHIQDYAEAFEIYKAEVEKQADVNRQKFEGELKDLVERVKAADLSKGDRAVPATLPNYVLSFAHLKAPVSHAKDYEQVIMMLEMEVEDTIELQSDQFACFVMDNWDWTEEFRNTTEFYKMSAIGNARR